MPTLVNMAVADIFVQIDGTFKYLLPYMTPVKANVHYGPIECIICCLVVIK